jgi:hypothetical protein
VITHTYSLQIKDDAGRVVANTAAAITADEELEVSVTVPPKVGGTNGTVTVDLAVDVSTMQDFFMVADGDVTMTENTSDLVKALAKGVPFWWYTGLGTNPFSIDVVTLKFDNAGAAPVVVHGAFLVTE